MRRSCVAIAACNKQACVATSIAEGPHLVAHLHYAVGLTYSSNF